MSNPVPWQGAPEDDREYQRQQDEELRRLQEETDSEVLHPCPRHPDREMINHAVAIKRCCVECYREAQEAYIDAKREESWMRDATDLSTYGRSLQAATTAYLQSRRGN